MKLSILLIRPRSVAERLKDGKKETQCNCLPRCCYSSTSKECADILLFVECEAESVCLWDLGKDCGSVQS